jgi:hypothetical protein
MMHGQQNIKLVTSVNFSTPGGLADLLEAEENSRYTTTVVK